MTATRTDSTNESVESAALSARRALMNNNQSTHNQTGLASMGIVLARLINKYLIDQTQKQTKDTETLKKVREIKAISAFTQLMKDKGRLAEGSDLLQAINYIQTVMRQPIDQNDRIIYWDKNEKGELVERDVAISVQETFAVVCAALMDESVYQYDSEEQREKAKMERLDYLCVALINVAKHKACHTDVRHELARSLNHNYPGIDFITVDFDFILKHTQEEIAKKLIPGECWRAHFKMIIWPWIKEGEMPEEAWVRLNATHSTSSSSSTDDEAPFVTDLRKSLEAAFLSHGLILTDRTTDNKKTVREAIDICCHVERIKEINYLPVKNSVMIKLYNFMRSQGEAERKQPEIAKLIQWLDTDFDANNNDHLTKLNHYFTIYSISKKIIRYSYLLKCEGHGNLLTELTSMIHGYFSVGLEASSELLEKIEIFDQIFSKFSTDKKPTWIENFFALWVSPGNPVLQRAHLFYRLCKPEYLASIRISDSEINALFNPPQQSASASSDENNVIIIEQYFLNRCFLHALTIPVAEWSETFYRALKNLYRFVENNFNTVDMRGVEEQLKRDSYPDDFLRQIKYLLECYELKPNKPVARRRPVVLTPATIDTIDEGRIGLDLILVASRNEGDPNQIVAALNMFQCELTISPHNRLNMVLARFATEDKRVRALAALVNKVPELSIEQVSEISSTFHAEHHRLEALVVLVNKVFRVSLAKVNLFIVANNFTNENHRLQAFKALCDKVEAIDGNDLEHIFSHFESDESRLEALKQIHEKIQLASPKHLLAVLSKFKAEDQRLKALNLVAGMVDQYTLDTFYFILSHFANAVCRMQAVNALKGRMRRCYFFDEAIIRWIDSNFDSDNQESVAKFHEIKGVLDISITIERYRYLFTSEGYGGLIESLLRMIDNYFKTDLCMTDLFRQAITVFNAAYSRLQKNKQLPWVDHFFELWFKEGEGQQNNRTHLFYRLCDPEYQKVIRVSDDEINDVFVYSEQSSGVLDTFIGVALIDASFLNRCFLHALSVPVAEWSAVFRRALLHLHEFVKGHFIQASMKETRGSVELLKKDYYPQSLLDHLKYLAVCYDLKPNRPAVVVYPVVFTPALIDSPVLAIRGIVRILTASTDEDDVVWTAAAIESLLNKISEIHFQILREILFEIESEDKKLKVLRSLIDKLQEPLIEGMIAILLTFASEKHRLQALNVLIVKRPTLYLREVLRILSVFKEDEQVLEAINMFEDRDTQLSADGLVSLMNSMSKTDHRLQALKAFSHNVKNENGLKGSYISKILDGFATEAERLQAMEALINHLPKNGFGVSEWCIYTFSSSRFSNPINVIKILKMSLFAEKFIVPADKLEKFKRVAYYLKREGIELLRYLCDQYLEQCNWDPSIFKKKPQHDYADQVRNLNTKLHSEAEISVDMAIDYVLSQFVASKTSINLSDDLFAILITVNKSMQKKNVNTVTAEATAASSSSAQDAVVATSAMTSLVALQRRK